MILTFFWLCLAAFAAGVMNAIAGGGTLLTFPTLLAALPESPVAANVTSTLALVPGSFASALGYRDKLRASGRWVLILTIPSLVGGIVGAAALLVFPEKVFDFLVPWLLLVAATLFLLQPTLVRLLMRKRLPEEPPRRSLPVVVVSQFFIGIYGGYFGAGIGILMLTSLAFLDLADIHEVNALKTWLAMCMNGISAVIFIASGKVVWPFALAMAIAAIAGGYLGARFALKLKPVYVRWIVITVGFGVAGYYFVKG